MATPQPLVLEYLPKIIASPLQEKLLVKSLLAYLAERIKKDPKFKWVILGGSLYFTGKLLNFDFLTCNPVTKIIEFCSNTLRAPTSLVVWAGEVESDIPFERLGYSRCLENDFAVLEKFGIPMNTESCIRDGITFTPGEFYQHFDVNAYDPKQTPMAWSYGPISDPSLIMPTGWYNDLHGENQKFELFRRYMRIFGYIPSSAYEELYQHCKILLLRNNQYLMKIGDPDDKIFIIVTGAVDVFSNRVGPHGDFVRLRTSIQGGQVVSLYSMVDVLTGNSRNIRSVFAISKLDTTKVLMFPLSALKDYLIRNPEYLVSSVVRLLERGYRFQYQIMHKSMHLMDVASVLNNEPLYERPDVVVPPVGERLSPEIEDDALMSFMKFLEIDDFDFIREHSTVRVFDTEEPTADMERIKSSILNKPETAYKFIYTGKVEQFYLKSNLSVMDRQSRRKFFPEEIIPQALAHTSFKEGVGSLTGILGYSDVLFYRVAEPSIVVTLPREALDELLRIYPLTILPIAFMTVFRMSPFTRALDFAMEWTVAKEGQYIYHKEQTCHDSFLILTGRARAYQLESESRHRAVLEFRENDWIGIIESLLQSKRRSKTCIVIRETEFIKIPNELLRNIVTNFSSAAQIMLNFLVQSSLRARKFEMHDLQMEVDADTQRESRRTRSIALIPVAEGIPYSVLALEIKNHYQQWGSCCIMTYEKTLAALRKEEISEKDQFQIEMYTLAQLRTYDLVIFICLTRTHFWNTVCSSHSEVMFSIGCTGLPNIPTEPPQYEEETIGIRISARRKELIIIHSEDVVLPRNTKEWLHCREWLHFHHHIRLPNTAFSLLGAIPEEELAERYDCLDRHLHLTSDLSRFIRWIMGKTFGVLFSSGGARIGAQLGMLQALVEYKQIPIDMVVGTGAGLLVAACYAIYQDYAKVQEIIEKIFRDFRDLRKVQWDDLSIPWISFSNGKRLLTYVYEMFGSVQLEDTWIPICCVTTNLTSQDVRVDRSGPLWVFVRASLSHIKHSPPICDPIDGDYICDGAHGNSLPVDVIKEYGAEYIIAFNTVGGKVEPENNKTDPNYSILQFLKTTAEAFLRNFGLANPTFEKVFNSLAVTQTRMYAAGVEAVSNLRFVVYVRPPVEHLPSQLWDHLPSYHRIGYFYMKTILDKNPYTDSIPFYVFWGKLKKTSTELANEGGRQLHIFN